MKPVLILCTLLLCPFIFFGQIIFDWKKQSEPIEITPVPNGETIIFKIKNINTFRYQVKISGKSVDYVTPMPTELQRIFRISSNSDLAGNANEAQDAASVIDEYKNDMNNLKDSLPDKESLPAGLNTDDPRVKKAELKDHMKQLVAACEELAESAQDVANIKFALSELVQASKQDVNHTEMYSLLPPYLDRQAMKDAYTDFIKYYYQAKILYKKAQQIAAETNDKEDEQRIKEASEAIGKGYYELEEGDLLKLIEDVMTLQTALHNPTPTYFEVHSPPIQADGDFVRFEIEITPSPVNDYMPYDFQKIFPIEVPVINGWKVDFSVGPTLSFGNNAKDDLPFLRTVNDTTVNLQNGTDQNAIRPGIAAMMHVYLRNIKKVAFAGLFGVGAEFNSIDDADLAIYLGGSLVMGKRQKVMVNFGLTWQRVARIKSQFNIGDNYHINDIDIKDVPDQFFKAAPFISVSYNLSNRVDVK